MTDYTDYLISAYGYNKDDAKFLNDEFTRFKTNTNCNVTIAEFIGIIHRFKLYNKKEK